VLLDHTTDVPCLELLDFFKLAKPSVPVITIVDRGSEELAVTVFRHGARDYFRKPFPLRELKNSIESALGPKASQGELRNGNPIFRSLRYIDQHFTERLRVSQAARETGMSLSSFERAFKRETGVTFSRYVNKLRISKAQKMLKDNNLSMNQIAFDCGFTNQYHFTRMFKKIMRTPPKSYRRYL